MFVRDQASLARLERILSWIRWFGAIFAGFQLLAATAADPPPPDSFVPIGWALVGLVVLGNLAVTLLLRRDLSAAQLRRLGLAAFALDLVVLTAFVWQSSYDIHDTTWVLFYVLSLEGAIRYALQGALFVLGLMVVNEFARDLYRMATVEDFEFFVGSYTFRVGIGALVALVAGYMARSLAAQAARSDERARQFEHLAEREVAARRELSAFHTTVLAGVAADDLDGALQSMVDAIGQDLGLDSLAIGVVDEGTLRFPAVFGLPVSSKTVRLEAGEGITGQAWMTGEPVLVEDVRSSPVYVMTDPEMRQELAVPLRVGDEIIGVLDVQSREAGKLTPATLDLMTRLADQIALVMNNARSLSRQRAAIDRMTELDEMKSDFVAITSHELRTPLTAIRGFIETLRAHHDRFSPEEQRHFLDIIDGQGRKLARLLEDLLAVSRLEAGQMRVELEEVEITALVADLTGSFENVADRIRLTVNADGVARLDPHRTSQVLRNLVQNALKFSPAGTPVTVEVGRSNGNVEFIVRDEGIGIPGGELERIFERFHQAGGATAGEHPEGAGLGLYISKRLVEAMGGEIEVRSEPGVGSTFRVTLPDGGPGPRSSAPPPAEAPAG